MHVSRSVRRWRCGFLKASAKIMRRSAQLKSLFPNTGDSLLKAAMTAECGWPNALPCGGLRWHCTQLCAQASAVLLLADASWRVNYEIIRLLSLDKLPDEMESKDANVCDAGREPHAYTVTFLWGLFSLSRWSTWSLFLKQRGFLANPVIIGLLMR